MCGISGFIGNKNISREVILETLKLMKNRGPDFSDYFSKSISDNKKIFLLHSRLSIIDLKERSNQPFKIGNYIIVFNGEIYNYVELRKNLLEKKIKLKTFSDTEILLNYFILYGKNCLKYFDGMWSFAIFDLKTKKLFLSRDPFGEKPLYIYKTNYGLFFGSEIKFLHNLSQENFTVNEKKINRYLSYGYKSIHKNNETFFKKVYSLENSSILTCDENSNIKISKHWTPKVRSRNWKEDELNFKSQSILTTSLKRRMRSDVPTGFLLSGGVDSGGLASLAVKKLNKKIKTFSIIDTDKRYNEINNIKKIAKDLQCDNQIIKISKSNFIENLIKQIKYHNSPVYTLAQYLHSLLMREIKKSGIKVVISGVGADELYSGYFDHYLFHLKYLYNKKDFKENLNYWKKYIKKFVRNPVLKNYKLFLNKPNFNEHIYDNIKNISEYLVDPEQGKFEEYKFLREQFSNRRLNEMFFEIVPAILNNEDLNAMMFSIENRSPYLSKELFETIYSIGPEHLIQNGYSKNILRNNLKDVLVEDVRTDRQKKGFNCSIKSLIKYQDPLIKEFLMDGKSEIFNFVDRKKFNKFLQSDLNENYKSKFLFSFLSSKIFLDNKF